MRGSLAQVFPEGVVPISLTGLVGLLPRLRHSVPYQWTPPRDGSNLPEEYMCHRREQGRITNVSIAHP